MNGWRTAFAWTFAAWVLMAIALGASQVDLAEERDLHAQVSAEQKKTIAHLTTLRTQESAIARMTVTALVRENARLHDRIAELEAEAADEEGRWSRATASWYGPGFYGNTMAGGGVLTPDSMVVAHCTLPFGTKVVVKYRDRVCAAVVMDRGPWERKDDKWVPHATRAFDLGPGVATALGFTGVGSIEWKVVN